MTGPNQSSVLYYGNSNLQFTTGTTTQQVAVVDNTDMSGNVSLVGNMHVISNQTSTSLGDSWTTDASGNALPFYGIAISENGQYQLAAKSSIPDLGYTLLSVDYGSTWTNITTIPGIQYAASMSPDGRYMLLSNNDKEIYRSTNYGTSWTKIYTIGDGTIYNACVSTTGQVITMYAIVGSAGQFYYSVNGGSTFTAIDISGNVSIQSNMAMSADGTYVLFGNNAGLLYKGVLSGSTYTLTSQNISATNVAMSSNGSKMYYTSSNTIYKSTDYGSTWSPLTTTDVSGSTIYANYLACSSDGQTIVTTSYSSQPVWVSTNGGSTFAKTATNPANLNWYNGIALSGDGKYFLGATNFGYYLTSTSSSFVEVNGNVTIDNCLTVGNTLSAAVLEVDQIVINTEVLGNLNLVGNETISGTLSVSGNSAFGNVQASTVNVTSNLTVPGDSSFNTINAAYIRSRGKMDVSGNLSVAGNENVTGTLAVTGNTTLGNLIVSGDSSFNTINAAYIRSRGNMDVSGNATVASNLSVTGNESITGTLAVTGNTTLGNLVATGDSSFNTLNAKYIRSRGNMDVSGSVVIDGSLNVNGSVTYIESQQLLIKDSLITLNDGGVSATNSGIEIQVSGSIAGYIKSDLSNGSTYVVKPPGSSSIGTMVVQDNTTNVVSVTNLTASGNLIVSGDSSFNTLNAAYIRSRGILDVSGNANISGKLSVAGNESITGTLAVTGNTTLSNNLIVTGDSSFNTLNAAYIRSRGILDVSGNANVAGNLSVTGNESITGTLAVTGNTTLGNLIATGDSSFNTLNAAYIRSRGILDVSGNANISGNLSVSGNTTFGNLIATGDSSFNTLNAAYIRSRGILDVSGNANISGNLSVTGNESITGTLAVTGNTTLGNTSISTLGAGVVHTDASGNLSSTLVFTSDISNANVTNAKLGLNAGSGTNNNGIGNGVFSSVSFSGSDNNAIGTNSLANLVTGDRNTAFGHASYATLTDGSWNTAIGHQAGGSLLSGSRNICVGHYANLNGSNLSNSIVIGSGATVTASDAIAIGAGVTNNTANTVILATSDYTTSIPGALGVTGDTTLGNLIVTGDSSFNTLNAAYIRSRGNFDVSGNTNVSGNVDIYGNTTVYNPITLSYTSATSYTQLGYQSSLTTGSVVSVDSSTNSVNLNSISIQSAGIWAINWDTSINLSNANFGAHTQVTTGIASNSSGSNTFLPCGYQQAKYGTINNDTSPYISANYSGTYMYKATSGTTLYLNINQTNDGAQSITAQGFFTVTRLG
jgi:cytoskeletal protein CcmA (bactofilin family)